VHTLVHVGRQPVHCPLLGQPQQQRRQVLRAGRREEQPPLRVQLGGAAAGAGAGAGGQLRQRRRPVSQRGSHRVVGPLHLEPLQLLLLDAGKVHLYLHLGRGLEACGGQAVAAGRASRR
jgi:hypothetical protein